MQAFLLDDPDLSLSHTVLQSTFFQSPGHDVILLPVTAAAELRGGYCDCNRWPGPSLSCCLGLAWGAGGGEGVWGDKIHKQVTEGSAERRSKSLGERQRPVCPSEGPPPPPGLARARGCSVWGLSGTSGRHSRGTGPETPGAWQGPHWVGAPRPCPPPPRELPLPLLRLQLSWSRGEPFLSLLRLLSHHKGRSCHIPEAERPEGRDPVSEAPSAGRREPARPCAGRPGAEPSRREGRSAPWSPSPPEDAGAEPGGAEPGRRGEGRGRQRGGRASAEPTAERRLLPAGRARVGGKRGRAQSPYGPRGCPQESSLYPSALGAHLDQ
ncbi:basic salivary proline-rich protein 1-like [Ovis aries]|uniref:basic salivary proline-rich protein 1-like n=1 Tax=Ovis aries TaxID=9940 RepID=UPI0029528651|nr:basic salivary proline-rich protein 1-like [Ovis aries]